MRIRSKFHDKSRPKSLEELAGALAFTAWRIGHTTVTRLYNDGFDFRSNEQLLEVIGEFLAFLIQSADRLAHARGDLDDEERGRFVNTLALRLVDHMVDNRVEELGPGEHHRALVIDRLNERLANYAEFDFVDGQPSYPMLRYFGSCVHELLGTDQGHNKWVQEQIAEVEAPAALKDLRRAVEGLLAQAGDTAG